MKEDNDIIDESAAEEPTTNDDIQQSEEENDAAQSSESDDNELHALDIAPSMSRTTNIPPRLPEGYSYASQPAKKEQKPQQATKHKSEPEPTDLPLRSEPTATRSKRYRAHKPNPAWLKTKRIARRYGWLIIFPAIAATYPLWGDSVASLFHSDDAAPAVAADTVPQARPVVVETDSVPQLTHEDSLRIQDSIRHARWLYWQRKRKSQAAEDNAANEEQSKGDAETTSTPPQSTTPHNGAVHRDSL